MNTLPFAEDVNYWKTSRSSPSSWIAKTMRQIEKLGGTVLAEAFGHEPAAGRAAFMLEFRLDDDLFQIVWPVLPSRTGNETAARVQAATMLYHDVKARCISAAVRGTRASFFSFLMLPDGRTMTEVSTPELMEALPALFAPATPRLEAGTDDAVEGEFSET